jgi:hypothetical protein
MTYDLFGNATSSPGSASGASLLDGPGGTTARAYGQDHALASLSARQAKAAGLLTSATSGPPSTISSSNAALRSSLASRLREQTAMLGSTLYRLTWMQRVMPSGLRKPALRASARRTSGPETIGWRTPTLGSPNSLRGKGQDPAKRQEGGHSINLQDEVTLCGWPSASARDWKDTPGMATTGTNPDGSDRSRLDQLPRVAYLAGWPTARAADGEKNVRTLEGSLSEIERKGGGQDLAMGAALTGWPSPGASDGNGGKGPRKGVSPTGRMPDGSKVTMDLSAATKLALSGWPTPMAGTAATGTYSAAGNTDSSRQTVALCGAEIAGHNLNLPAEWSGPARLTVSGVTLTGSDAGTKSGGQLSPAHFLWLMLGPFATAWASCGERVTRSTSRKRRASSAPSDPA